MGKWRSWELGVLVDKGSWELGAWGLLGCRWMGERDWEHWAEGQR